MWMFDRSVQTIARIPFSDGALSPEQTDINEKIKLYDAMCALCRPGDEVRGIPFRRVGAHQPQVTLPPVDAVLSKEREKLIAGLEATNPPSILSRSEQDTLFGRLSVLLSVATGAYTMRAKRHNVPVYEAESRHDWDTLLYHFYQDTEILSPYVMLEHTIHYPRNDLADNLVLAEDPESKQKIAAALFSRYCNAGTLCQAALSSSAPLGIPVYDLAQSAVNQANAMQGIFVRLYLTDPDALKKVVTGRSDSEPADGKCDAILFMSIPDKAYLTNNVGIIRYGDISNPSPPDSASGDDTAPDQGAVAGPKTPSAKPPSGKGQKSTPGSTEEIPLHVLRINDKQLENPFAAATPEPPPVPQNGLPALDLTLFKGHLLLPHVTAEYKKHAHSESKALNQGRVYLISVVSFYAALGIVDRPFYSLVTAGNRGAILMAWKSTKEKITDNREPQIYIMERNVCMMDISNPLEAFHFATVLIRLREDQKTLREEVIKKLGPDFDVEKLARWRKLAQPSKADVKKEAAAAKKKEPSAQGKKSTAGADGASDHTHH
ncbi:hypothetical protein DFH07DRAFT_458131 [Mycena maculata]|uniref:Uncharacterized protein n=1 Tax=Mycena maculata TaxID=230809 RepID=A0AAD7NF82_9AGAR|nr:hypothetical protein DFH07DRAFT_458131 [Mycena maculata]